MLEFLEVPFIHSDLAGNILFSFNKAVIIDISPDFRPIEYANTLLVTDSIAWHGEDIQSMNLLPYGEELKRQLQIRAIMFRLCVSLFHTSDKIERFLNEVKGFIPLLETIDPGITKNLAIALT